MQFLFDKRRALGRPRPAGKLSHRGRAQSSAKPSPARTGGKNREVSHSWQLILAEVPSLMRVRPKKSCGRGTERELVGSGRRSHRQDVPLTQLAGERAKMGQVTAQITDLGSSGTEIQARPTEPSTGKKNVSPCTPFNSEAHSRRSGRSSILRVRRRVQGHRRATSLRTQFPFSSLAPHDYFGLTAWSESALPAIRRKRARRNQFPRSLPPRHRRLRRRLRRPRASFAGAAGRVPVACQDRITEADPQRRHAAGTSIPPGLSCDQESKRRHASPAERSRFSLCVQGRANGEPQEAAARPTGSESATRGCVGVVNGGQLDRTRARHQSSQWASVVRPDTGVVRRYAESQPVAPQAICGCSGKTIVDHGWPVRVPQPDPLPVHTPLLIEFMPSGKPPPCLRVRFQKSVHSQRLICCEIIDAKISGSLSST